MPAKEPYLNPALGDHSNSLVVVESPTERDDKYDEEIETSQPLGPGFFSSQHSTNKAWRSAFRRSDNEGVNSKLVLSKDAASECAQNAWKTLWNPRAPVSEEKTQKILVGFVCSI